MGIAVGKKIGPAVARNRAKRLLREAAHARLQRLQPGQDIVLIGRRDIAGVGLIDVQAAVDLLLRRANLLVSAHETHR